MSGIRDIHATRQVKNTGIEHAAKCFEVNEKSIKEYLAFTAKAAKLFKTLLSEYMVDAHGDINNVVLVFQAAVNKVLERPKSLTEVYLKTQLKAKSELNIKFSQLFLTHYFTLTSGNLKNYYVSPQQAKDFLSLATCDDKEIRLAVRLHRRLEVKYLREYEEYKRHMKSRVRETTYKCIDPVLSGTMEDIAKEKREEEFKRQLAAAKTKKEKDMIEQRHENWLYERIAREVLMREALPYEPGSSKPIYYDISDCVETVKSNSRKKTAAKARKTRAARAPVADKKMPPKTADRAAAKETFENGGRKPYRAEGERGPKTRWLREFFKPMRW